MPIEFTDPHRARIERALTDYVREHFDHEMGELQSRTMFEFALGLVGAAAYNQAILDVQAWLQGKLDDLPGDVHVPVEFGMEATEPRSDGATKG